MAYSRADLRALGRTAKAVLLLAGATTLTSLVFGGTPTSNEVAVPATHNNPYSESIKSNELVLPFSSIYRQQALSPADDAFPDTVMGYSLITFARWHAQGSGDTARTVGNEKSMHERSRFNFSPWLAYLDTVTVTGKAVADTNSRFTYTFVVDSLSDVKYLPIVFFDARSPPFDTTNPHGVSWRKVDTSDSRVSGKGLVGKLLFTYYFQKDTSQKSTKTVFTNDRGPLDPLYVDLAVNTEELRQKSNNGDSLTGVLSATLDGITYSMDTTIAITTFEYGIEQQAEMFDTLRFIPEYVTGVKEEPREMQGEQRSRPSSMVLPQPDLVAWLRREEGEGNYVERLDASGRKIEIPSGRAGVSFVRIREKGKKNWQSPVKVVTSNGRQSSFRR